MPGGGFTHDVEVDASGIAWVTGEDGTFGYDTTDPLAPAAALPLRPEHRQHRRRAAGRRRLRPARLPAPQHEAHVDQRVRPRPRQPRARPASATCSRSPRRTTRSRRARARARCQTWRITGERNADGTIKLELLDLWTTELNELANATGRSPATANCSAHWFDEDGGLLAQGWYDQGVRFMDVGRPARHPAGRLLRRRRGRSGRAYFAPADPERETVYALDTASGLDVLHIERSGDRDEAAHASRRARRSSARGTTLGHAEPALGLRLPAARPVAARAAGHTAPADRSRLAG